MHIPSIFVFTHDSIGVGEDGPTHQPVEQLLSLRAMPGLIVLRPGDANEVAEAWRLTMQLRHDPVVVLSRQKMPTLDRTRFAPASELARGGYVLADAPGGTPEVLLIATGTEVGLAVDAFERLERRGVRARVVSLPSWELFDRQPQAYRDAVLPPEITARVAIEQASALGWERYAGPTGAIVAMRTCGFTPDAVVAAALGQL
jgi:transketolase